MKKSKTGMNTSEQQVESFHRHGMIKKIGGNTVKKRNVILVSTGFIVLSIIGMVWSWQLRFALADTTESLKSAIQFTPEEKAWLAENHTVRARIGNFPPYVYWKNGPKGIAVDTIRLIAANVGFEVKFIKKPYKWKQALDLIKEHREFDMIPAIINTPERQKYIRFTKDYIFGTWGIFTRTKGDFVGRIEDLNGKVVAVPKGFVAHDRLKTHYPELKLLIVSDDEEALKAVATSAADAYIGYISVATYMIQKNDLTNLKVAAPAGWDERPNAMAMGIRDDWPELVSIMNKGLNSISAEEHRRILQRYLSLRYEYGISSKKIWFWGGGSAILICVILGVTLLWNRSLQAEIMKRTQVEEALRQSKEAAESANRAKSTFLANMSHELRTPLNAILGFAQIMTRDHSLPRKHEENLATINQSGKHLLTLINQVLDLSKIEAGRITLDKSDFDLHNMLSELEEMFRIQADKKALRFSFKCSEDVPRHIRTDEVRLRQVLINLLNNALKFTKVGGVAVRTGIADSEDRKSGIRKLKFEIEDTGPGITSEETDKVFEAFVQTETGRKAQEGSGLGLPISKKFVQLMGGDITVRSEPGRGTTFTFDIQAGIADASEMTGIQPARRAVALEPGQPRYRILITDDKSDNRKLLVKLLNPFGFILREAVNGREAVEIWNQWQPHLILMDIRMPVMDGYEAVRKIRDAELKIKNEKSEFRHTAVIAVSASADEEERAVAISKGCDGFLRKPFREAAVFELMARHSDIRFVYENEKTDSEKRKKALTPEALATLPDDVIAEFRKAVLIADLDAAMRLCEQLRSENELLADALAELVSDFRFDTLQELFGKEEKNEASSHT
ncbi:transporter substrate-binding domain-containing protein [Desulfococcaceae bacterium HSG9]|nr:transporter substrate-binding domain-containing protein [Desulfococcaceae bacterium HSG9]